MPLHWPAAINQSVLCSPFCPFCLGVCLLCCFFIQAAQRHTNSHTLSHAPRFSISQREEPRAILFIVFRPMWVPQLYPKNQIKHGAHFLRSEQPALSQSHLLLLIFLRETIVLSEGNLWVVVCIYHSGKKPSITWTSVRICFLYLEESSKVLVHSSISVFALHTFLPTSFSRSLRLVLSPLGWKWMPSRQRLLVWQ